MTSITLRRGQIHIAPAEDVYPTLDAGSVSLVLSDGPYGLGKGEWDKATGQDLVEWYRPHVEAWGIACAPSASVYLWGTAESWATLHPLLLAHGWTFRRLIVWDKTPTASMVGWRNAKTWTDSTEVCGVYTRGGPPFAHPQGLNNIWPLNHRNFQTERTREAEPGRDKIDDCTWRRPIHPCQKPLLFWDRILRASSRPGDLILEPFGGTCRAAVAIERLSPTEARRYVCVEPEVRYVDAVLPSLRFDGDALERDAQPTLFATTNLHPQDA